MRDFTTPALALLACALCAAGLAPRAPAPAPAGALPFIGHDISSLLMMERDLKYASFPRPPLVRHLSAHTCAA
jgi:hypothetical protein